MWQQSPPVNQSRSRWRGGTISPSSPPLPLPLPLLPCTLAHDCSEREGSCKNSRTESTMRTSCMHPHVERCMVWYTLARSLSPLARPQVFAPSAICACPPAAEIACRGRSSDARCAIPSAGYAPHRLTPPSLARIILRTCRCSIMSAQKEPTSSTENFATTKMSQTPY